MNWEHKKLLNHCNDLVILVTAKETSGIDAIELFEELKMFCHLTEPNSSPNENIELIYNKKLQEIYPGITISWRIVLTIPVAVVSAERSFSKLKLIKNHLRSTMSKERLTGLPFLSIESNLAQESDLEDIFLNLYQTCIIDEKVVQSFYKYYQIIFTYKRLKDN